MNSKNDAGTRLACLLLVPTMLALSTTAAAEPSLPLLHASFFQTGPDTTQADSTRAKKKKDKPLPLEAARHVTFTTDEGSWLSLDVSPDGERIVFDLLGDLYTVPMAGGRATRLTDGMAFDGQPRYSPDGTQVVFTSDRDGGENLWIIDFARKDTLQLTKGKSNRYQSPEWTPDGNYIVASRTGLRSGSPKLWMFHKDGGSGIQLIKEPDDLKTLGPAFGPDDRYIWFAQRSRNWQYNAIFPQYQLAVYDRDTGKRYTRSSRFGSALRPTLSPDGKWLVYGTRHEAQTGLRLRDLETGEERWLAYPVQRDDQESRATRDVLPGMSFTPDSKEVVVSYGGKIWRVPVDGGEARAVPFTVEADVELGPELDFDYPVDDGPTFVVRQIRDAVPSPDGTHLAFVALDRLYVMAYPDGTPRRLTDRAMVEAQPVWSPDGRSIAFVTWSTDGGHLYKIDASGRGDPVALTRTPALYQQPAWSPDGERIVMIRGAAQAFQDATGPIAPGGAAELVWVPAEGGEATLIAPTDRRTRPHFTRDPDRIYLYSFSDGLLSIRWDGTDERHHVKITGVKPPDARNAPSASFVLKAPVGDQALAQVNNDLYVVTIPYVGGETPSISVANPDNAAFPARKLTEIGGHFPAWGADGRTIHWSIGNAHVVYDLDAAEAAEAARDEDEEEDEGTEDGEDDDEEDEGYTPAETRIRITANRDFPEGQAVLRGARVITMQGDEVIEDADLVIRNHRIEAVGPRGSVPVPDGAQVIDLMGKTIIPGFVDTHAHLRPAWGIHKQQSWSYLANLAYGVTTTRDPQTGTTDVLSYGDMVEAGALLGPRIYSTGPGVFWGEQIKDQEHARRVLKRYSEYYDTKTIKMYVAGNRQQRQWIITAARAQELMPTTEGSLNLKMNLTQIIDGYPGHEHSFPIYPLYGDVVRLVAASRTVYTPTLLVAYGGPWAENYFYTRENPHGDAKLRRFTPHEEVDRKTRRRGQGTGPGPGGWFMEEEHVFPEMAKFVKDLVEAGGRAGVGSHGQLQGLGFHWELWAMQSGGLSEHDALRVATLIGADAIGFDGDLGSIEPGKLADLIVLDANPLDDIRNTNTIRYVMKNGRLYESDTLHEVYPRQREAGPFWWQEGEEPVGVPGVVHE
ncbi:MAG: amidohydrolase family protein [Rhodothermales bacterium]